jgi:hypothetical protein
MYAKYTNLHVTSYAFWNNSFFKWEWTLTFSIYDAQILELAYENWFKMPFIFSGYIIMVIIIIITTIIII